jgi:hypothetical protein
MSLPGKTSDSLSKRDVFAAMAMGALLGDDWNIGDRQQQNRSIPALAELAYKVADEMLKHATANPSSR